MVLGGVSKVIGDGLSTQFWHDPCCGPVLLRVRFSRLFRLSLQGDGMVGDLGGGVRMFGVGTLGGGYLCLFGRLSCSMSCLRLCPTRVWVGRMCGLGPIVQMVGARLSRLTLIFLRVCRYRVP